jgi:general secretion pathway protein I
MVALAILASSMLAVSGVVGAALRNQVRARNLELATVLARAKMVQLEDHYEWKGFPATDESDEGSFDDEGHPEIKWHLEVKAPEQGLDGDAIVRAVTGTDLKNLLPTADQAPQLAQFQPMIAAVLQTLSNKLGDNVKRGLREVRLTVSWPESGKPESFEVKTYMLVTSPGETAPR